MNESISQTEMQNFIVAMEQADSPAISQPISPRRLIFDNFERLQALVDDRGYTRTQIYERMIQEIDGIEITKGTFLAYFNAASKANAKAKIKKRALKRIISNSARETEDQSDRAGNIATEKGEKEPLSEAQHSFDGISRFREHKQAKGAELAKLLGESSHLQEVKN